MKTIKVYNEIQSTCADTLMLEVEKLKLEGWKQEGDLYIDRSKGMNSKKYKMQVIKLSRDIFC